MMRKAIPPKLMGQLMPLVRSIGALFVAPKITIIVRAPDDANVTGDFIWSNDDPRKIADVLKAHMHANAKQFADGEPGSYYPVQHNLPPR